MSILNYILSEDFVILVSDSIASLQGGKPIRYVSKIFSLAHINSVICGTGSLNLIVDWYSYILNNITVDNVQTLDNFTSASLTDLYNKYPVETRPSSTIYQFGYLSTENTYKGYAYRSKNNFQSEELIKSIGIKPDQGIDLTLFETIPKDTNLINFLIDICKSQKKHDDTLPCETKLGIGGSIYLFSMVKNSFTINEIYTFDDKELKYREMIVNLHNMGGLLV